MTTSTYIHIPFCKSKCKYCSFVSFNKLESITAYIYSLLKEISENYNNEPQKTIYFGGGTPSLIPTQMLSKILQKFKKTIDCEITIEVNPDDVTLEYLEGLLSVGFNRLSIGSQTFQDNILKDIGRRHNSDDIVRSIDLAKEAGFNNISIDLIYGLPNQTIELLDKDLSIISKLDIQHISTYGLKIEEESYWGKNTPNNLPDDDLQADMYVFINNFLEKYGFRRYEISNFAKEGFESRHNLNYWNNDEYYGFGVAAHGYVNGVRYANSSTLEQYISSPHIHEYGNFITPEEKLEEEIFLGFRKEEGLSTSKIEGIFNIDFDKKYANVLNKYADYIEKTPLGYKLTLEGVLISNMILSEFLSD